jgi:hypothetical protein
MLSSEEAGVALIKERCLAAKPRIVRRICSVTEGEEELLQNGVVDGAARGKRSRDSR